MKIAISVVAALLSPCGAAFAEPVVDQEQTRIDAAAGFLGVGGDAEQKLGQTFTVGVTGDLVALNLPISACGGSDLVIELRNGSVSADVLATIRRTPAEIPSTYEGFATFEFDAPIRVRESQLLAFTMRMDDADGDCNYATSEAGDTYAGGESFFDARPNPPGWLKSRDFPGPWDLAFQTLMDNLAPPAPGASGGGCLIPAPGGGASRFAPNLPVCRCLRDQSLREFRCALLHPDFFAIRRFPLPIPQPGDPFEEVWEFYAIAPLDGQVRMTLSGGGLSKDVTKLFGVKGKLGKLGTLGGLERFVVKGVMPKDSVSGAAQFEYPMKDFGSAFEVKFGMERSFDPDAFGK